MTTTDHLKLSGSAPPVTSRHTGPLKGAADFLKSQYISRWNIICCAKQQTIAEHQYLCYLLVREWGPKVLTDQELACAKELALTHDLAEIRTGDCPTPFKSPEVKAHLKEVEEGIFSPIPVSGRVGQLVKFCDTAESILFLKLYGLGRHAEDVRELLAVQMWRRLADSLFNMDERLTLHDQFNEAFHDT